MFAHLHVHSYYSFLEGLVSPAELAQTAARLEMPALALTDHRFLTGAIEFYTACKKEGVKPIIGLEIDVAPPRKTKEKTAPSGILVLLAINFLGWKSLCRLSSAALATSNSPLEHLPFENLAQEAEGLICLTGGKLGLVSQRLASGEPGTAEIWLDRLQQVFPNGLYVEIQHHNPEDAAKNKELKSLADKMHLPVVATHNIYYLSPGQVELQRVAAAIRANTPVDAIRTEDCAPADSFFLAFEDLRARFTDIPEAIDAVEEIVANCQLELPLGVPHLPEVISLQGISPSQLLRQKAEDGARKIYGEITPPIRARLDHEFTVIDPLGYASLFLIVEEILAYAREVGVPFSSRGSAASSLVAHCLGITSPDPLRLNLYFERFLNPARATPPDIDVDLCSRRRDDVIDFVYRRFGRQRVAMVCTINRFRRRSALREVAKAHGLPPSEISLLAQSLPNRGYGPPDRDAPAEEPFSELSRRYRLPSHQTIFRDAAALIGVPHHLSIHPGGVVISPGAFTDLAPTQMASKGVIITQFDLESVEQLGLIKIDLLGIRGLTVLGDVVDSISSGKSHPHSGRLDILEKIPENDLETSELVRTGRTIGCFQIESPGMRATLRAIQASSQDDIMVALALYRPGPLTGGQKDNFIRRFKGQETTSYQHTSLKAVLEDTYGVILYQEQVLRIAHQLAGLTLADADLLRRAMSHFDPGKQMQTLKEKFISGVYEKNGIPEDTAERIWELMAAFAGYGFPKAHAASYAQVAWRSAWCKAHHPAVFMAAVLANWGGYYSQSNYLTETRRMGLSLKPPHVNYAQGEFSVSYLDGKAVLFMGLDQVRDLSSRTQKRILTARPFLSFEDFLARADPRTQEAENLVRVGAMEGLGSIPTLLRRLKLGGWQGGQLSLFSASELDEEDLTLIEKAEAQEAILGASVIAHRLEIFANEIMSSGALTTVDAANSLGQRVRVAGIRQFWRRHLTSKGDTIYFMSLEDLEGMLQVVKSTEVYKRCRSEIRRPGPYIVEGSVELDQRQSEPFLRAENLWSVDIHARPNPTQPH